MDEERLREIEERVTVNRFIAHAYTGITKAVLDNYNEDVPALIARVRELESENVKLHDYARSVQNRNRELGAELASLIADKHLLAQELANCSTAVQRMREGE